MRRDANADLLRIVSCLAVVGLHSFRLEEGLSFFLYKLCGFSVPMFFVLSGYFLLARKEPPSRCIGRVGKVAVQVLSWNALYWAAVSLFPAFGRTDGKPVFASLWEGFLQEGVFWHFWFFGSLLLIYIILPMLRKLLSDDRGDIVPRRLYSLWAMLLLVGVTLQALSVCVFRRPLQAEITQCFRLWTWLQYFLLGGILSLKRDGPYGRRWISATTVCLVTLVVVLYQSIISCFTRMYLAEFYYDSVLTVVWVVSLFVCVIGTGLSDRAIRTTERLSPYGLGIYIIHPLVRPVLAGLLPDGMESLMFFPLLVTVSLFLVMVLGKIPLLCNLVSVKSWKGKEEANG